MNYEEYLAQREIIENDNKNLIGNILNEAEEKVDNKLSQLKSKLKADIDTETLYKMNLLKNDKLWTSELYQFIKDVPKGADLHVHATALLPAWKLIDFVMGRPELTVDVSNGIIRNINDNSYDRTNCYPLAEAFDKKLITRGELENKWTLLGRKHNENVWEYFENLFEVFDALEFDCETLYHYYVLVFNDYLQNNINHIEIHSMFSQDPNRSLMLASAVKRAYFDVKKEHPELSVSIICAGLKYLSVEKDVVRAYMDNSAWLSERIFDDYDPAAPHRFIIGFDLVNEEDKSVPLRELAPMLLEYKEKNPDIGLFIHCGESLDAQSDNLIDGYLLGAKRVGHGMNLYRFPKLLNRYADSEICLECCLISNQTLRYTKDLRLHPGAEYLKRGVTISLCSDDPVCQEHETLVDDFFAAAVCWDLDLSDIKQLCINSIMYSGVDQKQKSELISVWKNSWKRFIEKYSEEN